MSDAATALQRNQELANRINAEALRDPKSPFTGKFVGLIDGQVYVVADTLEEMDRKSRESGVDQSLTFGIEAGYDYDEPDEIWALCRCRGSRSINRVEPQCSD